MDSVRVTEVVQFRCLCGSFVECVAISLEGFMMAWVEVQDSCNWVSISSVGFYGVMFVVQAYVFSV